MFAAAARCCRVVAGNLRAGPCRGTVRSSLQGCGNLLRHGAPQSAAAGFQRRAARRAVNVPRQLLKGLEQHAAATGARPLLIQLSSDQVYAGTKAFWTEADACDAINVYGRSKVDAECVIQARRCAQASCLQVAISCMSSGARLLKHAVPAEAMARACYTTQFHHLRPARARARPQNFISPVD